MNENSNRRPVALPEPIMVNRSKRVRWVGWLIVVYIFLLMVEGALRKWVAPQISNPLLVIRDPILVAIYFFALRARVFPWNGYLTSLAIIAILSLLMSAYVLGNYIGSLPLWITILYGFRSNFLHMPLIFLIANVFDEEDVRRIGWWFLLGLIPMSLLMVAQFKSSPSSFINATAGMGEGAEQLATAGGRIRPAGTFSFISGPIFYCGAAAAFLLYGIITRSAYRLWILVPAGVSLVVAVGVSGSRACLLSVLLVVGALMIVTVIRPQVVGNFGRFLLIAVVALLVISRLPVFKEGVDVLSERFTATAEAQETTVAKNMVERVLEGFTEGLTNLDKIRAGGWGLGIGTNVGARFLIGGPGFILSEKEWTRVLYESGPFLGLAFLMWRLALTFRIGYLSLLAVTRQNATLPLLLFSSGFFLLLNGQLGQPTTLGFAVVLCGLCLASMQKATANATDPILDRGEAPLAGPAPRPLPRRSPYAARLHGPDPDVTQDNGFVDR